jgi:hypothetical protein
MGGNQKRSALAVLADQVPERPVVVKPEPATYGHSPSDPRPGKGAVHVLLPNGLPETKEPVVFALRKQGGVERTDGNAKDAGPAIAALFAQNAFGAGLKRPARAAAGKNQNCGTIRYCAPPFLVPNHSGCHEFRRWTMATRRAATSAPPGNCGPWAA